MREPWQVEAWIPRETTPLTINILVIIDEDARSSGRMSNSEAGNIGVRHATAENVESQLAKVAIHVTRHAVRLVAEMSAKSFCGFRTLSFEVVSTQNEFERNNRTIHLSLKLLLTLTEKDEFENAATVVLREFSTVHAVERISLLKRS
jgi:hypothetical protein